MAFRGAWSVVGVGVILLAGSARAEEVSWLPWSDDLFARAAAEKRLVLLDLGAVWCHWCHVMDRETYGHPEVARLLREGYLAVRVDQDQRPDLANRYEDYGWPATVIFRWDGAELAKLRGFLPPERMIGLLRAFREDPTPGPSVQAEAPVRPAGRAALDAARTEELAGRVVAGYDHARRGWGSVHKWLQWDAVEWCMARAQAGDRDAERMARETLAANLALVDPVWGGVYQYSDSGDWDHPHFEKIMSIQAENLRLYARAFRQWGDPAHRRAGDAIVRYLLGFLAAPDGAFWASQDADRVPGEHAGGYFALDDRERRARGMPRVDRHQYARENGLAACALAEWHQATGDETALAAAVRAAEWALAHRARSEGGFRHDERDPAGPYCADTLALGRAFLALYEATAERAWLARAEQAVAFVDAEFRAAAGFLSARPTPGSEGKAFAPRPQWDENLALGRLAARLAHATGGPGPRAAAEHALRWLAAPRPDVAWSAGAAAGVLLLARELADGPLHVTVVGPKSDPAARALFAAAIKLPPGALVQWLDEAKDGPLPLADLAYPVGERAVAYVCGAGRCSAPLADPAALTAETRRFLAVEK